MMISYRLFVVLSMCCCFMACDHFLDEQSQDLTYAASCEDLNEILIGSGYMSHDYFSDITLRDGGPYYPYLHVMDDDIEEFTYSSRFVQQYMTTNADVLKSFYCWKKDVFQNKGSSISDYEWARLYKHIASLNVIIKEVEKFSSDPQELQNKVRGESMFLRAGYYWLLANFYSAPYEKKNARTTLGVPLKLTEYIEDKIYHRATLDSVYQQIVSDLKNAAYYLQDIEQPSVYRATEEAAHALLSRVYLYMGEWQAALDECEHLEDKFGIIDLNNFSDDQDFLHASSPETIFIQGTSVMETMYSLDRSVVTYKISSDLLNCYDRNDLRQECFFYTPSERSQCLCLKIQNTQTQEPSGSDIFMIRYPEVLLNKAEALAMLGRDQEAIRVLEKLLIKRYKNGIYPSITESGEELVNYIRDERRRELCCEGHRWFDLRRYAVSPLYPYKKTLIHNEYERNAAKIGEGEAIGYYELKPWPEGTGWVFPIPNYELEMSDTQMQDNKREDAEYHEI